MGTLRTRTNTLVHLLPDTLLGRSERTDVCVDDRAVSSEHARLRWTGRAWVVRDLGSKNGTWVDGRRLEAGGSAALAEGSSLALGSDAPQFHLASTAPPCVSALDDAGVRVFGAPDLLGLPDPADPEVMVVGDGGTWRVEGVAGERPVADGDVLEVAGRRFRLSLPEPVAGTWDRDVPGTTSLADTTLHFRVSRDEEHVELDVEAAGRRHTLGSKAHHYLLLVLARLRVGDAPEVPESSRGWVGQDELVRMLGAREGALHTAVFRARAELAELGLADGAGVVERRKGSRQLRLGVARCTVTTI
jgi:pSer/pThr/pTyr-binding forkhead associated (FHA) protein